MADFLTQARKAEAARQRARRTAVETERIDNLAQRIDALPDDQSAYVMEVLTYARDHYKHDPLGIQKAEADLARIKAAAPDADGVLGGIALDEEFED